MGFFFDDNLVYIEKKKYKCYLISQKNLSDWYLEPKLLDKAWLKKASLYGLGAVRDVCLTVGIKCDDSPILKAMIYTKLLDGFLGPDPLKEVDEVYVSQLIEEAKKQGWPNKENLVIKMKEVFQGTQKPTLVALSNMNADIEYENIDQPVIIWKKESSSE